MIGVDTNILIDLLVINQPGHEASWETFKKFDSPMAITSVNLSEALQLLTHEKVFPNPMSVSSAVSTISSFLSCYDIMVVQDAGGWWCQLPELVEQHTPDLQGNDMFDAQVAYCLKYNGIKIIWTKDSDFRKYPFLKIVS